MSALMEQHEHWVPASARLWGEPPRRIKRPKRLAMERLIERVETPPPAKKPLFVSPVFSALPTATVFPNSPHWRAIAEQVCAKHGVTFKEIVGPSRVRKIVAARHEAFFRIRNEVTIMGKPMSYPEIAKRFGRHDHTTTINGVKQHAKRIAENRELSPLLPAASPDLVKTPVFVGLRG